MGLKQHLVNRPRFVSAGISGLAIALAAMTTPALADSYCGPGRHVGAENDGPGKSWTCVPDGVRGSGSGSGQNVFQTGPTQADRVAAGMALGAAGFELIGSLLTLLGDSQQRGPTQQELEMQEYGRKLHQEYEASKAQAQSEAALYAEEGRKAANAKNYAGAFAAFRRAYERSGEYEYRREMIAMEAILHLQEALALTAEKKRAPAYAEFFKAKALAKEAIRPDIANNIEAYRVKLFADISDAQKSAPGAAKPTTNCVPVNGEFVCD